MSKVMRSVKNVTKGYSSTQVKVREATSNDPWGPTGTQMSEIAQMTFNTSTEFYDIMDMVDKRLNDKGKNWRHVLKALKVLDYCLHEGSEMVVTWARQNVYIIKTLREFQYIDEDGRDVGQNVRVAAKELTSLILDENRLRAERSDRRTWKSRVSGLEDHPPPQHGQHSQHGQYGAEAPDPRRLPKRPVGDEDDTEYRLAIEASKQQEEEDRRKREGQNNDDDLAKAIKLSKEEEERRRRALEDGNASLFDDDLLQLDQPQYTGFNQGYQQGNQVDFFANPIDQSQMQAQPTGYPYAGFQTQPTGFQPQPTGFQPQPTGFQPGYGMDPYGQHGMQGFQPQPTGFNPYAQQQLSMQTGAAAEPALQPGSNNPWATNNSQQQQQQALKPAATGSNNPFASGIQFGRPATAKPAISSLGSLPEREPLASFSQPKPRPQPQPQPQSYNPPPQKNMTDYESKLNSLLATGDGMDTYGNTGELRIPAQHTAPGTYANSAGSGVQRLNAEPTGSNPFMRQQFTGMPAVSYGAQASSATGAGGANPFGAQRPQQQASNQDLIQF
ncbi:Epsin-like protein ent1/2 [Ophiocordyceps camponoti-floridani]|uniref:Epsin-like protein ent1/2 n=1 Tax=Ophiocordyceps camponoti-floridani TaxID=2030778 RepID=A0A8H4VGY9_9HYPO|nr:Epsin-like protein ent1/2 [Ophiocordyceps camponoti-floridani]